MSVSVGGFIGGDWGFTNDLSNDLSDDWRSFNEACIPVFLEMNPDKTKVAAGLACGMLHTQSVRGCLLAQLCRLHGTGVYRIGRVKIGLYSCVVFSSSASAENSWFCLR